jgi:hypothetical protein
MFQGILESMRLLFGFNRKKKEHNQAASICLDSKKQ